jgi:alpha-L-fucosidase 2
VNKPLILEYNSPAPEAAEFVRSNADKESESGWERWSLPLGNSRFGASVFGRLGKDRVQITENSLANPILKGKTPDHGNGGVRSFCDLIFDFGHDKALNYKRELSLDDAVATVAYDFGSVAYKREYFVSYPDNVLAMRFTASRGGKISFSVSPYMPFCGKYCLYDGDGCGRSGEIGSVGHDLIIRGVSDYYNIKYEGRARVKVYGGKISNENGTVNIKNADSAEIYFTCATNYKMESRVFAEPSPKAKLAGYPAPGEEVLRTLNTACMKSYEALKAAHMADHRELFSRVSLSVGGKRPTRSTDEILEIYKMYGKTSVPDNDMIYDIRYIEELIFQYGRYLLIASSRRGG